MILVNIIFSVLYLFCVAKANSFLQLNGYRVDKNFFAYFKTDFSAFAIVFFAISCLFFVVFKSLWIFVHTAMVFVLATWYFFEPKKTPLRLTWRMKRLLVTEWLLFVIVAFIFNPLVFVLLPFVSILANQANAPVELCIQANFVQKAKIKLTKYPQLKVVAITGSYAKTSVKNILSDMLSTQYKVVKTPGSFNTPMGIVKTINQTNFDGVDFFVCEMGARHVGDIRELCDIVKPDYAILTGISCQHMGSFGCLQNVIKTKLEIFDGTKKDGVVFVNHDCKYLQSLPHVSQKVLYAGKDKKCDLFYGNEQFCKEGCSFDVEKQGEILPLKTKLLGAHTCSNLCLCALAGLNLGLKWQNISSAVNNLDFSPHRLQLSESKNGVYILDDSYNANPDGVKNALDTLSLFDGKKFVVMAGVVDCGRFADEINVDIGEYMATRCDFALLVGINSNSIKQGLLQKSFDPNKIFCCTTLQNAVEVAGGYMTCGDVILFCNDLPDNII